MSQELIYTSAPRGLKPGSQGFCTVVSTQGIAVNLAQRLEALSGYRHVFPPPDPNARLNPVLYSHLHLNVSGRRCYLLSRVCDAGLDHTQRTNKFAHHMVLEAAEAASLLGGPAWLLAAPGFMQSTWDGVPRTLVAARRPPAGNSPPMVCRAWQSLVGDAGWGGALAQTAAANRPAIIVFRPGVELLPLLVESLALLPPPMRWNVSFSTYYSKLPPGLECQWRCVLEGSPEAIANQRLPGALVIDLTRPLGPSPGGPLIEAARTGVVPRTPATVSQPQVVAGARRANDEEFSRLLLEPAATAGAAHAASAAATGSDGAPATAEADGGIYDIGPPPRSQNAMDLPPQIMRRDFKRKPKSKWPILAGLSAGAAILVMGIIAILISHEKMVAQNARPSGDSAATAARQDAPLSGKSSGDGAQVQPDVKKTDPNAEKKHARQQEAEEEKEKAAELKRNIENRCDHVFVARDAVKGFAKRAADSAEAANKAVARIDLVQVEGAANYAMDQAGRAETEANNASDYARDARDRFSKAGIKPPSLEVIVKKAEEAATEAEILKAAAKKSRKDAQQAVVDARRAQVIADSLGKIDGVVPLPRCRDDNSGDKIEIAELPTSDAREYAIELCGKEKLLPPKWNLHVDEAPQEDGRVIWRCHLRGPKKDNVVTDDVIIDFVVDKSKVYAKWREMAKTTPEYSNQVCNSLLAIWHKKLGKEKGATISLGAPEPASLAMNAIKFTLDPAEAVFKRLDLSCLLNDSNVAVEPLADQHISTIERVCPSDAERVGPRLDADGNTPRIQEWHLAIRDNGKARIKFALKGEKLPIHGKTAIMISMTYIGEDCYAIDQISNRITDLDSQKQGLAKQNADDKDKARVDNRIKQIEKLDTEISECNKQKEQFERDLKELKSALRDKPLRYSIVLRFGDKNRVLFTSDIVSPNKPRQSTRQSSMGK